MAASPCLARRLPKVPLSLPGRHWKSRRRPRLTRESTLCRTMTGSLGSWSSSSLSPHCSSTTRPIVEPHSADQSLTLFEEPLPDCRSQVGGVGSVEPRDIDSGNEGIQRTAAFLCCPFKGSPEN